MGIPLQLDISTTGYNWTPVNSAISDWLAAILDGDAFEQRILNGEIDTLLPSERQQVLYFAAENNVLHHAVSRGKRAFVLRLIEAGADINALDKEGKSPLTKVCSPLLFRTLRLKGAECSEGFSCLPIILEMYDYHSDTQCTELLKEWLPSIKVNDFFELNRENIKQLLSIVENDEEVRNLLKPAFEQFQSAHPEVVIEAACVKLDMSKDSDYQILSLAIKNKILSDAVIKCILIDDRFVGKHLLDNADFYDQTRLMGTIFEAIIHTTNLEDACSIITSASNYLLTGMQRFRDRQNGGLFQNPDVIDSSQQQEICAHIVELQKKGNKTIWGLLDTFPPKDSSPLRACLELGFDPNWTDPYGRNLLFTRHVVALKEVEEILETVNTRQIDILGHNALEYTCLNTINNARIKYLTAIGLSIHPTFKHAQYSQFFFPSSNYLQSTFINILKNQHSIAIIANQLAKTDSLIFIEKVKSLSTSKDPIIHQISRLIISQLLADFPQKSATNTLTSALQTITLIKSLSRWKQSPIKIEELFSDFSEEELLLFGEQMFADPLLRKIIIKEYFNLKQINITWGGGSRSTGGAFIAAYTKRLNDLHHIPETVDDLSIEHRKLIDSFHKPVAPLFIEALKVYDVSTRVMGRTVIITSEEGFCDAFKFKRVKEKYKPFSAEKSVTEAFNKYGGFHSQFHTPMNLYMIRKLDLPTPCEALKEELGDGPFYAYHYRAPSEIFTYLQHVNPIDYPDAQQRNLIDATKMVRLGIYPDLSPLFHNENQGRPYVLLIDILHNLVKTGRPQAGAGRLDQPFEKTRFPNMRQTGLTDLYDASSPYGIGQLGESNSLDHIDLTTGHLPSVRYFYQMYGLSNIFLVDMLISAMRHIDAGILDWKNKAFLNDYGKELAHIFTTIGAAYANKDLTEYHNFTLNCEVDWTRMARQIAFWCDTGDKGYRSYMNEYKPLPSSIYEVGVDVFMYRHPIPNYDRDKGFHTNGKQDIGTYNGCLGLTEFEKAAQLFFIPVSLTESAARKGMYTVHGSKFDF